MRLAVSSRPALRPWVNPPATPAAFSAYVVRCRSAEFRGYLVCRREDERIVAVVNLSQIFLGAFCSAYLGYWCGAQYQGRGYMTEGLGLVLRDAFTTVGLHRVEANIQPGNERSIRLVERLGFRLEGFSPGYLKINGRWRDHQRWAMRREEFRTPRSSPGGRGPATPRPA